MFDASSGSFDPSGVLSRSASVARLLLLEEKLMCRVNLLDLELNDLMTIKGKTAYLNACDTLSSSASVMGQVLLENGIII